MNKIKIITDSTADLPEELVKKYDITVVPLKVMFGQQMYLDRVNLSAPDFYQKLKASSCLPTTSQPSPKEFVEFYRPFAEEGDSIISIHISSELSGTVQSARLAKTMINYEDIEIIDSRLVSMALGLVCIAAAKKASLGSSKKEVLDVINYVMTNIQSFFVVDTLEYLQKGGRIGKAQAFLGSLLKVKPICMLREGFIYPYEKARGRLKAIDRLFQVITERFSETEPLWCALVHGDDYKGLSQLEERVKNQFSNIEIISGEVGSVVGTHAGPGLLGILFCSDPFASM